MSFLKVSLFVSSGAPYARAPLDEYKPYIINRNITKTLIQNNIPLVCDIESPFNYQCCIPAYLCNPDINNTHLENKRRQFWFC